MPLEQIKEQTQEAGQRIDSLRERVEQRPTQESVQIPPVERAQPMPATFTEADTPPMFEPTPPPDDLSLKDQVEKQRVELESMHQSQLESVNKKLEEAKKREAEYMAKQEDVVDRTEPLTTPFREELEKAERERLKVEENFFQNQALTDELDKLLTESIEMTRRLESQRVPGLAGIQQSERMTKAQENAQSRIAVIESVMSARQNQIGTALNFIDRSVEQIQADRQDRLNYLDTLFSFYEGSRTEEGEKIFNLTQEQKQIFEEQKSLITGDLERAETNAERIKQIIKDNPQMAAESGISISDTEEEITRKIADWEHQEEVREMDNQMSEEGLKFITPEVAKSKQSERVFVYTDSEGKERHYEIPMEEQDADWNIRTIGKNLYRVNPQTGDTELLIRQEPDPIDDPDIDPSEAPTWEEFLGMLDTPEEGLDQETKKLLREIYDQQVEEIDVEEEVKAKDYFTNTQISKGASAAGMSISEFGELPRDEANRFIYGTDEDSDDINPFGTGGIYDEIEDRFRK